MSERGKTSLGQNSKRIDARHRIRSSKNLDPQPFSRELTRLLVARRIAEILPLDDGGRHTGPVEDYPGSVAEVIASGEKHLGGRAASDRPRENCLDTRVASFGPRRRNGKQEEGEF